MAFDTHGYRYGERQLEKYGVDSSAGTIYSGDHVKWSTAGYIAPCGAGDNPIGVAIDTVTAGAADGDVKCEVDISEWSVYEYPVGTGTATVAMIGTTCDLAGARSADVTASSDDNLKIVNVDTVNNRVFVRHLYPTAGVV